MKFLLLLLLLPSLAFGAKTIVNGDQVNIDIKATYESNADTNAFSDAEKAQIADHETRIGVIENSVTADLDPRVAALELTATDHELRVGALETSSTNYVGRLNTLESFNLDPRVSALELTATDHETRIGVNEISISALGEVLTSNKIDVYDSSGGMALTLVYKDLIFDTRRTTPTVSYSYNFATGELTFLEAGEFLVMAKVTTSSGVAGSRAESNLIISIDTGAGYSDIPGTLAYMYNRQPTVGKGTGVSFLVREFASGDKIKVKVKQSASNPLDTLAGGSSLVVINHSGVVGPQGPAGPGTVTSSGASGDIQFADGLGNFSGDSRFNLNTVSSTFQITDDFIYTGSLFSFKSDLEVNSEDSGDAILTVRSDISDLNSFFTPALKFASSGNNILNYVGTIGSNGDGVGDSATIAGSTADSLMLHTNSGTGTVQVSLGADLSAEFFAGGMLSLLGPLTFDAGGVIGLGDGDAGIQFVRMGEPKDDTLQLVAEQGPLAVWASGGVVVSNEDANSQETPLAMVQIATDFSGRFHGYMIGNLNCALGVCDNETNLYMDAAGNGHWEDKEHTEGQGAQYSFLDNGGIAMVSTGLGATFGELTATHPSALVEIKSTTKGFLPPRMSDAQKEAIATPAEGLQAYNTTANVLEVYNGTKWITSSSDTNGLVYDPVNRALEVSSDFGNTLQVGQESYIRVVNRTGVTISDGEVVHIVGYDAPADAFTVELALADNVEDADVDGVATTVMLDDGEGFITTSGRVNDLDTSMFSGGDILYLDETTPGGLTNTKPPVAHQVARVGKVDASTGWVDIELRELAPSIKANLVGVTDQTFTVNTNTIIIFDSQEVIQGVAHSTTTNPGEITFISGGNYYVTVEPQLNRSSGASSAVLDVFIQKDVGAGWVDVANSNIKKSAGTAGTTGISPLTFLPKCVAGDKIRFVGRVSDAALLLDYTAADGPNNIPATPSVILNIFRTGD